MSSFIPCRRKPLLILYFMTQHGVRMNPISFRCCSLNIHPTQTSSKTKLQTSVRLTYLQPLTKLHKICLYEAPDNSCYAYCALKQLCTHIFIVEFPSINCIEINSVASIIDYAEGHMWSNHYIYFLTFRINSSTNSV